MNIDSDAPTPPRVLGLLVGDLTNPAGDARIKYGQLFAELQRQCELLGAPSVELAGLERYENAVRSLRWPKQRWREAFQKNPWSFGRISRRARQLVQRQRAQIDVVFQHGTTFSADLGPGGPPFVIYSDFTYRLAAREDPWRNPFGPAEGERWNQLEHQTYHRAAYILTRSEYTRRSLLDDYGVPPERVVVVGGGLNFATLPAPSAPNPTPRVLFIGKDWERKGGPQLLQAFERVRAVLPSAELWLVTQREGLAGAGVRRIAPTHDHAAIAELYRSCSVFAMPSRCETWGDVFLEAMAYGLPCIGTTNDAMPEIIAHGETGYVVVPDDVLALANYLEQLLRSAELRARMGQAGRERVANGFTWAHVVGRMRPWLVAAGQHRKAAKDAKTLLY